MTAAAAQLATPGNRKGMGSVKTELKIFIANKKHRNVSFQLV